MKASKLRLDELLVACGLAPTRAQTGAFDVSGRSCLPPQACRLAPA